jgi:hypothetical protein
MTGATVAAVLVAVRVKHHLLLAKAATVALATSGSNTTPLAHKEE